MKSSLKVVQPSFWSLFLDGKFFLTLLVLGLVAPLLPILALGPGLLSWAISAAVALKFSVDAVHDGALVLLKRWGVVYVWRHMPPNLQRAILLAEHFRWNASLPLRRTGLPRPRGGFLPLYDGAIILGVSGPHRILVVTTPRAMLPALALRDALSLWVPWVVVDCCPDPSKAAP